MHIVWEESHIEWDLAITLNEFDGAISVSLSLFPAIAEADFSLAQLHTVILGISWQAITQASESDE